jgi:tetratricopeptide (TPR) repeat protein
MTLSTSDDTITQAVALFRAGNLNQAELYFRKVLQIQPTHIGALNLLGVLMTQLGRYSEAEPHIKTALELNPNSDATLYNYAIVLKFLKRPIEALEYLDKAISINEAVAENWNNRGTVLNDLGRHNEAIASFKKAVAIQPNYPEAVTNIGNSLIQLKRYGEASAFFENAIAMDPRLAEAWLGRARCSIAQDRDSDALLAYEKFFGLQRDLFKRLGKNKKTLTGNQEFLSGITSDSSEYRTIINTLRLLKPNKAVGFKKIRVGSAADGGYIQLNDFTNITHAISLGVSTDDNWDVSLALRGIPVDQFDHSILEAPTSHRLLNFHRKMVSAHRSAETTTLEDIVAPYFRHGLPDLILKMDIESDEWDVLDNTSAATLSRFAQIVCEFHSLHLLRDPQFQMRVLRVLEKLGRQFSVIHTHANNFGGFSVMADKAIPHVLEVTYANRDRYSIGGSDESLPTSLDFPCDPYAEEILLEFLAQ